MDPSYFYITVTVQLSYFYGSADVLYVRRPLTFWTWVLLQVHLPTFHQNHRTPKCSISILYFVIFDLDVQRQLWRQLPLEESEEKKITINKFWKHINASTHNYKRDMQYPCMKGLIKSSWTGNVIFSSLNQFRWSLIKQ